MRTVCTRLDFSLCVSPCVDVATLHGSSIRLSKHSRSLLMNHGMQSPPPLHSRGSCIRSSSVHVHSHMGATERAGTLRRDHPVSHKLQTMHVPILAFVPQ